MLKAPSIPALRIGRRREPRKC